MKRADKTLAHLYVWAAIAEILEGSTDPGREDSIGRKQTDRVLKIAHSEQQRLCEKHDKALAPGCGDGVGNG